MVKLSSASYLGKAALSGIVIASLAGAGVASYAIPAFAENASVTISSTDNAGATYDAYQLFTADVDDSNNATHVQWGPQLGDHTALLEFLGDDYQTWVTTNNKSEADNPQNAAEYIAYMIDGSAGDDNDPAWVNSGEFADELAQWCVDNLTAPDGTATEGQEFTGAEGYWLFLSSAPDSESGIGTAPIWFALGGSSATVTEKASLPTISKAITGEGINSATSDDVEIGDTVSYDITTTIPGNYHSFDEFYYKVSDSVPAGFTLSADNVKVTHNGVDITAKFNVNVDQSNLLTVEAADLKTMEGVTFASGDTITVSYTAILNNLEAITFGGEGNINEASLEYSNDPYADTHGTINTTDQDKTRVYSFELSIDKTDASTGVALENAKFVIHNEEGKYLALTDGKYAWSADSAENAAEFATDAQGKISEIPGLDAGTYTLTEVASPDGYVLPGVLGANASFEITVTPTYDESGVLTGLTATTSSNIALNPEVDEAETSADNGIININVTNDRMIVLALTGAQGLGMLGVLVIAAGAANYAYRRYRKNSSREE